jgi:hypothetical protein
MREDVMNGGGVPPDTQASKFELSLIDISLDVYSGPTLLRGKFYAASGFMHSNKTTFTFSLRVQVSASTLKARF